MRRSPERTRRCRFWPQLAVSLVVAASAAHAEVEVPEFGEANHPQEISAEQLLAVLIEGEDRDDGPVVVDARGPGSYARDHIPGAINVHVKLLFESTDPLEKYRERPIVLYCGNGRQSARAARKLVQADFRKVFVLVGTIRNWRFSGYPLTLSGSESEPPTE